VGYFSELTQVTFEADRKQKRPGGSKYPWGGGKLI
jgi:hypothetical protein